MIQINFIFIEMQIYLFIFFMDSIVGIPKKKRESLRNTFKIIHNTITFLLNKEHCITHNSIKKIFKPKNYLFLYL